MFSGEDPARPAARSQATSSPPVQLLGRGWRIAELLLLASALILGLQLFVGCTPAELQGAHTASTVCKVVEAGATVAVYEWEAAAEQPIVEAAVASGNADVGHAQLAEQRAKLKPLQAGLDGLDLVCTALAASVKAAQADKSSVPGEVVAAVFSSVAKLVKLLLDAGVKVPPAVVQLVQQA